MLLGSRQYPTAEGKVAADRPTLNGVGGHEAPLGHAEHMLRLPMRTAKNFSLHVHTEEPGVPSVDDDTGQVTHAVAPLTSLNAPFSHNVQLDCPGKTAYLPAVQESHVEA